MSGKANGSNGDHKSYRLHDNLKKDKLEFQVKT